ncbi:hypothetical protein [Sphingomonas yabuuchiae]|nr:hypothetical protein [Sphingomonas yabuuchiae]
MPPRGQPAMMHDALLDLGLLDQRRALGTIDHVDGSAADHGAASDTGRQFCQGHSHRHRHILKRFRPANDTGPDQGFKPGDGSGIATRSPQRQVFPAFLSSQ